MIPDHDRIVLTGDLPEEGLKAGDVGTGARWKINPSPFPPNDIHEAVTLFSSLRILIEE